MWRQDKYESELIGSMNIRKVTNVPKKILIMCKVCAFAYTYSWVESPLYHEDRRHWIKTDLTFQKPESSIMIATEKRDRGHLAVRPTSALNRVKTYPHSSSAASHPKLYTRPSSAKDWRSYLPPLHTIHMDRQRDGSFDQV